MSAFGKLFGGKFDDSKIEAQIRTALSEDPLVLDPSTIAVSSQKGVITLSGVVHKAGERDRVEGVARTTVQSIGLKFDHIENKLEVH